MKRRASARWRPTRPPQAASLPHKGQIAKALTLQGFDAGLFEGTGEMAESIQSYAVVNEYLARLNANSLAGPHAPDFVLLNADSMDGRYPSTEDNLEWPELLARYQPAGFDGDYLALRKARGVPATPD